MKAVILGAGKVGLGIAQYLIDQKEDVVIVDNSRQVVNYVKRFTAISIVLGDALDINVLKTVLLDEPSLVVAAMPRDEQNIVACKIVGCLFKVSTKIARIRSQIFTRDEMWRLSIKNNFNIDAIIQPEVEIASSIVNVVPIKNVSSVAYLSSIVVVSLRCIENAEILNTPMKHFENISDFTFYVLMVTRDGKTLFPSGTDVLLPNDEAYFVTDKYHLGDVLRLFGYSLDYKQNILIIGGGSIGETLVEKLTKEYPSISITLLEKSRDRANEIAQKFPKLMVMFGDAQNYKLLRDASIDVDTAIIATDDEKINILSLMFLKKFGVSRVFALSNNKHYEKLISSMSGCIVINPNAVTVSNIIKYSYNINGVDFFSLPNTVSVVESKIPQDSVLLGKKVEAVIAGNRVKPIFIIREGKAILAKKHLEFSCDDIVVSIVPKEHFQEAQQLFTSSN